MPKKDDNYVSMSRMCLILDVSAITMKRWYTWYESPRYEVPEGMVLPRYEFLDKRGTKYFKMSDIPKFKKFIKLLHGKYWGCMAQYNADVAWGVRGENMKRREFKKSDRFKGRTSGVHQKRKPKEYAPKNQKDPTDNSENLDRKEEEKWRQEQEREMQQRRENLKG